MERYVIEYELDYKHRVQVGIEANSGEEAGKKAEQAFANGTIWDDTAEMPLLFDDYEESGESGTLIFKIISQVDEWPVQDASVIQIQKANAAMLACRYLVDACMVAQSSGTQVDWKKAYRVARFALGAQPASGEVRQPSDMPWLSSSG
jgi:hypothetical protein